ncbi:hypothetical protein HOY80DRAFT_569312 [Tuber brumale]|nr:hypothetical protein HOY80DRAFT_569312 [Tuber brumale]
MESIENLAEQWLAIDNSDRTRSEIRILLQEKDTQELEKRLRTRIEFGTAGLRARMEAGFSRMNDVTVIQASQGLASYLNSECPQPSVVIGYDHRHNSERFAKLTAAAMIRYGIKVYYYDSLVHTPLVPFGVNYFKASAGVMITASHNPAQDNGYKVYWGNGCQIIPPHDKNIAQRIGENLEPKCWDVGLVDRDEGVVRPVKQVTDAYFAALRELEVGLGCREDHRLQFVYTPMHGVGLSFMWRIATEMGLGDYMMPVSVQATPDPNFPTVKFPNPEEKGALDLAIATAERKGIHLVLASDPDADRFAAAEKLPSGKWHVFTGNQLGILFAAHVVGVYRKEGKDISKLSMLASTVSTQMLRAMADTEGFHYNETLTGFKWLGNRAIALEKNGYDVAYAFEEAIGYMFSPIVHDKDGIAAASVFLTMARQWAKGGFTVFQKLEQLYQKYGYFEAANSYFTSPDPLVTKEVFAAIRNLGDPYPAKIGNRDIIKWRDLTVGYDSSIQNREPELPVSKNSEMITVELENGVRFTVRASGTEPKIKMYIECSASSSEKAKAGAQEVSEALTKEWFRPAQTGLKLP